MTDASAAGCYSSTIPEKVGGNYLLRNKLLSGWFVFENGEVHGPYEGKHLVTRSLNNEAPGDVFVSKQGFSRWYPIEKLADIIASTTKMDDSATGELRQLEELVSLKLKTLSNLVDETPRKAAKPQPQGRLSNKVVPQRVDAHSAQKAIEDFRRATVAPTAAPVQTTTPAPAQTMRSSPDTTHIPALPPQPMNYRYFIMRARLRLGAHRNSFVLGCLVMPLTLFSYWVVWYREAMREIIWHSENSHTNPTGLPLWLATVPVLHIYMTYCLALMIQRAERQNQYSFTSPALAMVLSLFPPFAAMYLQSALNKHWDLHVRSIEIN